MEHGSRNLLLLLMGGTLFFVGMGEPLLEPQEARYAEVAREMLGGDWIVPHFNGRPYLDKPPLLYWCTAISYSLFGVNDCSTRLMPGLAALATVLVTFLWGRRAVGSTVGFSAAAILLLMPQFVYRGRWLSFDSLLCLWVTLSLATAHIAAISTRFWPWWLVSATAAGMGLLTKGPVVFVLAGAPLFLGRWVLPSLRAYSIRRWLVWGLVAALVAAPWFAAISIRHPEFIEFFFWKHHVERFVTPFDHQKPFWFYFPELLFGLIPWIVSAPSLIRWCWSGKAAEQATLDRTRWLALAALGCILFFSVSGSKRATYILPAFPPLALAMAFYLNAAVSRKALSLWRKCAGATWLALLGILIFWWPFYTHKFSLCDALEPERENLSRRDPVLCYPRMWDGVTYYLRRSDVQVYGGNQRTAMMAEIERADNVLLIVKPAQLQEVVDALPRSHQAREVGRSSEIVVVRIENRTNEKK